MNTRLPITFVSLLLGLVAGVASASAEAPDAGSPPVVPNAGFEEGLANWSPGRTSSHMSQVIPEAAHSGTMGLRMTDSGPGEAGSLTSGAIPLGAAKRVTVGFWGRLVSGKGAAVTLVFLDEAGAEIKMEKTPQIGVYHAGGKNYSTSVDVPTGATQMLLRLRTWSPAEVTADFDDFTVTLN